MNLIATEAREATPQATAEIVASVIGLEKSYVSKKRDVRAVRGIDLHIQKGEYVVVLGPSGCGKSTLMRCIAGLERPTGGTVDLHGQTVFDLAGHIDAKPERRNVGMVFQNYALWPHMTIENNVAYPLKRRRVPTAERQQRVKEVLATVECSEYAKRLPAELSGGQQQRIALARAIAARPALMLLDEPLSNLDALLRVSLRSELLRLHRELGFTALHITHDQAEALEMGDRVVLMKEGQIEQIGTPEEVYTRPASPYAATFLGVRNKVVVNTTKGSVSHPRVAISGLDNIIADIGGETIQIFARPRDVAVVPRAVHEASPAARSVSLSGTIAQIVLSEGGTHQFVVDIGGVQWFAQHGDANQLSIGDEVVLSVSYDDMLVYNSKDELVERYSKGGTR